MIKELKLLLNQIHEPDEFLLENYDGGHPVYHIWILRNAKFKDLHSNLRRERPEHARFDVFVNGQWILEQDYILEQQNKDILVKFIKANFDYILEADDKITIVGDVEIDG